MGPLPMTPLSPPQTDVLIVGAGPTGLLLALWLKRLGVEVRIIDKSAEPGTTSRALAVHARTLKLYGQIGLVALADPAANPRTLENYLDARGLLPPP